MGLCHEFGSQIRTGCNHPMRAGASACSCAECGVVCRGLFDGCPDVWERGPRPVAISATRAGTANGAPSATTTLPRPEPARPTAREGAADGAPVARRGAGPESDAGTIAYLEAAPVAIGPGIVGRPPAGGGRTGTDPRSAGDARRGGADPGDAPRQDRSTGESGSDTPGDPRREVFRWFEEAFEGVRAELQALIGSMTHQQAMLAELLDSRQAELRLALVAESLPDLVSDAVGAAMEEHTTAMAGSFDRSHERFRDDIDQIRADTADTVESLSQAFQKLSGAIAVHDEEAEQREAVRLGALKGSVTRQITPLTDALAQLAAKVDALADRIDGSGRSPSSSSSAWAAPAPAPTATKPAAPAKPLAAKGLAATTRTAPRAAPPAIGKRVSTARMNRGAAAAEDPPVTPKRVATARVATGTATAAGEPARVANGAASPVARRVATGRVATARSTPAAPPAAARTPPARVATARVGAARASTTAASDDESVEEAPVTAPIARVLTRRRAPDRAPALSDEPVVVYELEAEEEDEEDDDADWAPPAWVSAVARERAASPPSRTPRSGRTTRP